MRDHYEDVDRCAGLPIEVPRRRMTEEEVEIEAITQLGHQWDTYVLDYQEQRRQRDERRHRWKRRRPLEEGEVLDDDGVQVLVDG